MGTILDRITEAQNRHDAELFASYFMDDYRSIEPVHPARAFLGTSPGARELVGGIRGRP